MKWDNPHDKFLDALALIRITVPEFGDLNQSDDFAILLDGSTDLDKAKMIACLASLCTLIIKKDIYPEFAEGYGFINDEDFTNKYLDGWIEGVVDAEFVPAEG